jgi:hypothetical protein
MSATKDVKSNFAIALRPLNTEQRKLLSATFDANVSFDIEEIKFDKKIKEKQEKETSVIKRICWFKTITYPFEFLFLRMMVSKESAVERKELQTIFWKLLRNRVDFKTFKTLIEEHYQNHNLNMYF